MKKKTIKSLAITFAMSCVVGSAHAGAIIGATEPTQIMNNIQLVMSYIEQAQQTATQLKQYETMLKNLQQMTPSAYLDQSAQKLWSDQNMMQTFRNLRNVVVNGQRISYDLANMDGRFKQIHPGYDGYGNGYDFQKAYRNWSDNTLDAVKNAMSLASVHANDLDTEQQMVNELQNRSSSAQGQLQAVQAGNQIGISMVGQLQKLRQMQMAQTQAQNAFIAGQQSAKDADDSALRAFYGPLKSTKLK